MAEKISGEVIIEEAFCSGCGYCTIACTKNCIEIKGDKSTPQGFLLPSFIKPEECTACGFCALMCPAFAIEVYAIKSL